MTSVITQDEIDRLRAPFPLKVHSIREGNKVRGGQGIQWFVYVEKTEVENRLNEVFPGEWGSTVPVLTVMGNAVAATIGITIRGITRGNTGEDSNGTEKAKGATTDAFRRAAADWGVAKYLWEMDFSIYTDSYPDKDWKARDAREKEAFEKFAGWYKQKFQNITPLQSQNASESHQEGQQRAQAAGDYEPQARTPQQRLAGNGAPPAGQKKDSDVETREWMATKVTVRHDKNGSPYLVYVCKEGKPTGRGRDMLRNAGYDCEEWTVVNTDYELIPPAAVTVQKNGQFWNVLDVRSTVASSEIF